MKIPVLLKLYGSESSKPVTHEAELDSVTGIVDTPAYKDTRHFNHVDFAEISPVDAPELNFCVMYNMAFGAFLFYRKSEIELFQKLTDGLTDEVDVFYSPIVYSELSIIICEFGGEWSVIEVRVESDKDITKDNFTEFPEVQQALARSTISHSFLLSWRQYEV